MKLTYDIVGERGSLVLAAVSTAIGLALLFIWWRLTPDQRSSGAEALVVVAMTIAYGVAIRQITRWLDGRRVVREIEAHERAAGLEPEGDLDERLARVAGRQLRGNAAFQQALRDVGRSNQ